MISASLWSINALLIAVRAAPWERIIDSNRNEREGEDKKKTQQALLRWLLPSRVGPPTPEVDPRAPEVGPQPQRAHHDHFCHPISFPCTHPSAHSRHLKTAHIGPLAWKNSLPPWRHRLSASCFVKSVTPNPDLATYSPTVFMAAITMALKTPFCSFPCMSDTSTRVLKGASVLFIFCVLGP